MIILRKCNFCGMDVDPHINCEQCSIKDLTEEQEKPPMAVKKINIGSGEDCYVDCYSSSN